MNSLKSALVSVAVLVCCASANAGPKITVAVGHMCCGSCKAAATQGLAKVAENVSIENDNITLTPKGDDLLPTLEALRKSGFPAKMLEVEGPVTLGITHLCCGKCRTGLSKALTDAEVAALDSDSINIASDSVTLKAKPGMKLDLVALIAGMEKGGFSPSKIVVGTATAKHAVNRSTRIARR
jgi:bacterioferritin-associated ferredoxin